MNYSILLNMICTCHEIKNKNIAILKNDLDMVFTHVQYLWSGWGFVIVLPNFLHL